MKNSLISIITLAMLMHLHPAFASVSAAAPSSDAHPISSLIGDWSDLQKNILSKTKSYNKYSDIKLSQVAALPQALVGTWRKQSNPAKPGYQLETRLNLAADNKFTYQLVIMSGDSRQEWDYSGDWEVKDKILMLLIDHSTYPGEDKHDVLFWRLLHLGKSKLVYVKSGANELFAMNRVTEKPGSAL
jgi:hypothetical protein